jgi:DNA polymerase III subunit gamma/tau
MISLARKYRPRKFSDVSVQSHVSTTLKGAIAAKRIAPGYLLSGPRGVGKTTLARVLAMALNCDKNAPDGEPCGECESCKRIWAGSTSMDVVEIDAASNRGVDDARELRERAMYAPSGDDRYKVYIVDEAHMLTREAWNALLKILEEPPPRVVFVFATTEPHKIAQSAAPVLSRLQRFDFKRIGPAEIRARLETVLAAEKATAEPEALGTISRAADGSMRDALSLVDQVMAMGDGTITAARVRDALGLVPEDEYIRLLDIIADRRAADVFPFVGRLADAGVDFGQFLAGLGDILRAQLSVALGGEPADVSDHARAELISRRGKLTPADLLRMLTVIGDMEIRFKRSGQQQLLIETLLVRFALLDRTVELEALLKALGEGAGGPTPSGGGTRPSIEAPRTMSAARPPSAPSRNAGPVLADSPAPSPVVREEPPPPSRAPGSKSAPDLAALTGRWDELVYRAKGVGKALLGAALSASSPRSITKSGDLTIQLDEPNDFHARAIEQDATAIAAMLGEWFTGVERVLVHRETTTKADEKPRRVTDEMVKTERLNGLRRKDRVLDSAIDVLDLEIAD